MGQSPMAGELWKQNFCELFSAIEEEGKMETSEAVVSFP